MINNKIKNKLTRSEKLNLKLTIELEEILFGLMLGDLHAERRKTNHNTRIQFKQSIKNKNYIEHLYSLFKPYCNSNPKSNDYFDKRLNKNKFYSSIKFWTFSLPCFNKFRTMFYPSPQGIKILPLEVEILLTVRGLAYWIMDDGYKSVNGFYICTESFSLNDNLILKKVLKNKFNLECGIHKHTNGPRLYIFNQSKLILLELIRPYLIPHFYYKFDIKNNTN